MLRKLRPRAVLVNDDQTIRITYNNVARPDQHGRQRG